MVPSPLLRDCGKDFSNKTGCTLNKRTGFIHRWLSSNYNYCTQHTHSSCSPCGVSPTRSDRGSVDHRNGSDCSSAGRVRKHLTHEAMNDGFLPFFFALGLLMSPYCLFSMELLGRVLTFEDVLHTFLHKSGCQCLDAATGRDGRGWLKPLDPRSLISI